MKRLASNRTWFTNVGSQFGAKDIGFLSLHLHQRRCRNDVWEAGYPELQTLRHMGVWRTIYWRWFLVLFLGMQYWTWPTLIYKHIKEYRWWQMAIHKVKWSKINAWRWEEVRIYKEQSQKYFWKKWHFSLDIWCIHLEKDLSLRRMKGIVSTSTHKGHKVLTKVNSCGRIYLVCLWKRNTSLVGKEKRQAFMSTLNYLH